METLISLAQILKIKIQMSRELGVDELLYGTRNEPIIL